MKTLLEKQIAKLESAKRALLVQYSFGKIKTWFDFLIAAGWDKASAELKYPSDILNSECTFDLIKEYFQEKKDELSNQKKPSPILQEQSPESEPDVGSYELAPCSTEKAQLQWFQKKAAKEILEKFSSKRALYLVAAAGYGKTFIAGAEIARMIESKWHTKQGSVAPWPYLYLTRTSVVEQTRRVFKQFFGIEHGKDILITNIESLRSKEGSLFVEEKIEVINGVEVLSYKWRPLIRPKLVICDEGHSLKNPSSKQSIIMQSLNDCDDVYQLFISATPGGKVNDFKCFTCATRVKYTFPGVSNPTQITNENWNIFASNIASPSRPDQYCKAAADRIREYLDDYFITVKGVKPQFKPINRVEMINFSSVEGKKEYENCVTDFEKKKNKLESKFNAGDIDGKVYQCGVLTAILRYRMAAEGNIDRIATICDRMYDDVTQYGKAAVAGFNFRGSIASGVEYLITQKGVSRDDISLIWGGGMAGLTSNEKAKKAFDENDELMAALKEAGLSLEDLNLEDEKVKAIKTYDESWRLGPQSLKERQKEIDRFQSGKTLFCFFIYKSGGVGLSLHHSDELTKEKVRHKASGYAIESDIELIPTRQRRVYLAPTWSPFEMVQALGRVPRLTSLSNTEQHLIFFRGTIEERVAEIVSKGLNCLSKVVRVTESWQDMIVNKNFKSEIEDSDETDNETILLNGETENED